MTAGDVDSATPPMTTAYLTVDDAPSDSLPAKVAALDARDVPALFFCEGRRLTEYPDHARAAVEAGYHLGNHAYSHEHASSLSPATFREEVAWTEALLDDVYEEAGTDRPVRTFRFPYGDDGSDDGAAHAAALQDILAEFDFVSPDTGRITYDWYATDHADRRDWYWTIEVQDWTAESPADLRERVASESVGERLDSDSADIVLFHDAGNSLAEFEAFVDALLDRGVEFGTPLDLVE